jgi:hypothetical protein
VRQEGRGSGDKRAKDRTVQAEDDESSKGSAEEPAQKLPRRKKQKAAVRKAVDAVRAAKTERQVVGSDQKVNKRPNADTKCFACGGTGHFTRECPDPEARTRTWCRVQLRSGRRQKMQTGCKKGIATSGREAHSPTSGAK